MAFDETGALWVMAQKTLLCLRPGDKQFRVADENLSASGFTLDADGKVITYQLAHHRTSRSSGNLNDGPHAYPVLRKDSTLIVDRTNSVWIMDIRKPIMRIPTPKSLTDALSDAKAANPEM